MERMRPYSEWTLTTRQRSDMERVESDFEKIFENIGLRKRLLGGWYEGLQAQARVGEKGVYFQRGGRCILLCNLGTDDSLIGEVLRGDIVSYLDGVQMRGMIHTIKVRNFGILAKEKRL